MDAAFTDGGGTAAQDIGPLERPVGRIFVALQQAIDQLGAFGRVARVEEGARLLGRGEDADRVEVNAPQKHCIIRKRGRVELELFLLGEDMTVDVIGGRRRLEGEFGIRVDVGEAGAADLVEIADQHGDLAGFGEFHAAPDAHGRAAGRIYAEDSKVGDIANLAAFEMGSHRELLRRLRLRNPAALGDHFQAHELGGTAIAASLRHPAHQDVVSLLAGKERTPPWWGARPVPLRRKRLFSGWTRSTRRRERRASRCQCRYLDRSPGG